MHAELATQLTTRKTDFLKPVTHYKLVWEINPDLRGVGVEKAQEDCGTELFGKE